MGVIGRAIRGVGCMGQRAGRRECFWAVVALGTPAVECGVLGASVSHT
jgi:hypothetical protein